jgi:hypothetical protein
MSWAGLDSTARHARDPQAAARRPTGRAAWLGGIVAFGGASVVVFGSAALAEPRLYGALGVGGAYALWTLLYVVVAGTLLARLVPGRGNLPRFVGVFALGFALYSVGWCAGWFTLKWGWGELLGTLAGAALLHAVLVTAFGRGALFLKTFPVIAAAHLAGYFLGEGVWLLLKHSPLGMTLWGLIYGVLVGASLGWTLDRLQRPVAVP